MTPHPQLEYIIDDWMLQVWRTGCVNLSNPYTDDDKCRSCEYRGKGVREGCCDFDDDAMQKIFQSHPHTTATDRDIPDVLICQSLPNEHGCCGTNDCFCKELQRIESGDICKWMQENRKKELRTTPQEQRHNIPEDTEVELSCNSQEQP